MITKLSSRPGNYYQSATHKQSSAPLVAHQSVMMTEVLAALNIKPRGIYIDSTYGGGGHSHAILAKLGEKGRLIALDKDPIAYNAAKKCHDKRFVALHSSFSKLAKIAAQQQVMGKVNGVLFDIGLSSQQLDDASRGFSFLRQGPLDMRMDTTAGITAAKWLATVKEKALAMVLHHYGQERYAKRIARAVIKQQQKQAIDTTKQLAHIITAALPLLPYHKHPATRCFQAIRIFINQELQELEATLGQALEILAIGGRLVVISFHSLEDRIVKKFIAKYAQGDRLPRGLPIITQKIDYRLKKIGKACHPDKQEVAKNRRARSAILRVAEKIA